MKQEIMDTEYDGEQEFKPEIQEMDSSQRIPRAKGSSLVLLTQKFVEMLKSRPDHAVNLKTAADFLNVQKRRIYDITNVLDGIGLLQKVPGTPKFQWTGGDVKAKEAIPVVKQLEEDNFALKMKEKELDLLIKYAKKNLDLSIDDPIEKTFSYVTRDDLLTSYGDRTLLAVKNEKVLLTKENANTIRLKTGFGGHVDVRLVTEGGSSNIEDVEDVNAIIEASDIEKSVLVTVLNYYDGNEDSDKLDIKEEENSHDISIENKATANILLKKINGNCSLKRFISEEGLEYKLDIKEEENSDDISIEDEVTANILLKKINGNCSLKRFISEEGLEYVEKDCPLLKIIKPDEDYRFSLKKGEGLCELLDIEFPR